MSFSFQEFYNNESANISINTDTIAKSKIVSDDSGTAPGKNEEFDNFTDTNALFFYDKTAFIRYFDNKYSAEELSASYNEAVKSVNSESTRAIIHVVRRSQSFKDKKSFSGNFDIKPVPGPH